MNLKFVNRKQKLGISNPSDFAEWARKLDNEPVERSDDVCKLINGLLGDGGGGWWPIPPNYIELNIHPTFNALIRELGLEFQHLGADDTAFTKAIQSMHADVSKIEYLYFNIMDLRPISELGSELNDIQLLDKMMAECGCDPIGECWIEYSSEVGKKTLKTLFEYEVRPVFTKSGSYVENTLADQFLSHFDHNVRFYGNDGYAPWDRDNREITASIHQGKVKQSKSLQSTYETDFGLVIRDDQNIGFLLLAVDNY